MKWMIALLVGIMLATAARGQVASSEELHRLVREKEYSAALQKIAAGLQLRGTAAKAVNRFELYMLKGECHLQMKAMTLAIEAYGFAAREAGNDAERGAAAANAHLMRQSKGFAYAPKSKDESGKPKAAIDILDGESRKKAFAALLADETAANDAKLKAARTARTLPPLMDAAKAVATMEGLEQAATGKSEKSSALRAGLTEQSKKVVSEALKSMSKRISEIDKEANTFVEFYQDVFDPRVRNPGQLKKERAYRKKGLSDPQYKELQEVNGTCDKLPQALETLAVELRSEEKAFEAMASEAGRIRKEVDRILDTDYQRVYKEIPKK